MMKADLIKFLRSKKVLGDKETEWNVRFSDGRKLSINDLFIEFTKEQLVTYDQWLDKGVDQSINKSRVDEFLQSQDNE